MSFRMKERNHHEQSFRSSTTSIQFLFLAVVVFMSNAPCCRAWFLGRHRQVLTSPTPPNPLWPSGISDNDVDSLVELFINDPTINIGSIPDAFEKQIYRSTIKMCLDAIYENLGSCHGLQMFGHELRWGRYRGENVATQNNKNNNNHTTINGFGELDETFLEQVANNMLRNKVINQKLIPDVIERRLYVNCLKLIFRLVNMIAASFRLTVCGHEIRFAISKATRQAILTPAMQRAAISIRSIKQDQMREFARKAGVHDEDDNDDGDEHVNNNKKGFIRRILSNRRRAFLIKLHASLYGLMLGILDDLLASTHIDLLSDRMTLDLAPAHPTDDVSIAEVALTKRG